MGGKTSAKSKNNHTRKAYDRIPTIVPKGLRAYYTLQARMAGFSSLNSYIWHCVDKDIIERRNCDLDFEKTSAIEHARWEEENNAETNENRGRFSIEGTIQPHRKNQ